MSLLQIEEARALVQTSLTDTELQVVIDRIEADITTRIGAPYLEDGSLELTEIKPGGTIGLFLKRPFDSVTSVTDNGTLIDSGDYQEWPDSGMIERLPAGATWTGPVSVVYAPKDQRPQRKAVIVDLVRLVVSRQPFQSENIAGEWAYQAPAWEREYTKIIRRIEFVAVG